MKKKHVVVSMALDVHQRLVTAAARAVERVPGAKLSVARYLLASALARAAQEELAEQIAEGIAEEEGRR